MLKETSAVNTIEWLNMWHARYLEENIFWKKFHEIRMIRVLNLQANIGKVNRYRDEEEHMGESEKVLDCLITWKSRVLLGIDRQRKELIRLRREIFLRQI